MKLSLNTQILIGAIVGVVGGFILSSIGLESPFTIKAIYICGIMGGVFVGLLKMILIPLIFASITVGIANLRAHAQMGRIESG